MDVNLPQWSLQTRPKGRARDHAVLPLSVGIGQARFGAPTPRSALEDVAVMEETIQHHNHMKSTNMFERINEEIKRGTPCRAVLPQPGKLPSIDPRPGNRDAEELDRGDPILEYVLSK